MPRNRQSNKHLPMYVVLSHGAYYYKRNNKWTLLSRNYAEALKRYADIVGNPSVLATMNDLFKRYMIDVGATLREGTQENIRASLQKLALIFGHQRPADIRSTDIYRYLDHRAKTSKTWANKDKSTLNQVFIAAIRWGVIEHNPCRDVKGFSCPPRTRLIKQEEFDLVYSLSSDLIKSAMLFAYYTKCRQGEMLAVKFDDIKDGHVRIKQSKTGKELLIEISDKLSEVITRVKSKKKIHSFYLFSNKQGQPYTSDGFKTMWQRAMNKAMENGLQERFTFHDIRAMAVTYTAEKHGIQAASDGAGHTTTAITQRVYCRGAKKVKATE